MSLKDDPCIKLRKVIYKNMKNFGLYRAAINPLIFSCPDVVEWMKRKVDHSNRIVLNFDRKHVVSYQPYTIHQMYHFKETQIKITQEWLHSRAKIIDYLSQMKGWWDEEKF